MRYKDKTVIVTGGGGTIGGSLVKAFYGEGANVVLLGRSLNPLVQPRGDLPDPKSLLIETDVTVPDDLKQAKNEILQKFELYQR